MKSIGVVRQVDQLGRIVVPKDARDERNMRPGDPVEMWQEGEMIIFERYYDHCTFCGSKLDVSTFKEKAICAACKEELCALSK